MPCDSHGLQLLVKDIVEHIPVFKATLEQAQAVVKAFKNAPLQLSFLREYQVQHYQQPVALILSVITRWGTQYRLVNSLIKSKDALQYYAVKHAKEELAFNAHEFLVDSTFWSKLDALRALLKPIDDAIKASESNKSDLAKVLPRWAEIFAHFQRQNPLLQSALDDFLSPQGEKHTFQSRYRRQVKPIHIVAHFLTPSNYNLLLDPTSESHIYSFFNEQAVSVAEATALQREFWAFRSQSPPFESQRDCWRHILDPTTFWAMQAGHARSLGLLAQRISQTPANSVPSERAFSIQNLIHSKQRNRLSPERANKLTYMYMNSRVLWSFKKPMPSPYSLTNAEEVELEEQLLRDEEGEDDEDGDGDPSQMSC